MMARLASSAERMEKSFLQVSAFLFVLGGDGGA